MHSAVSPIKVLIVDDNRDLRALIADVLAEDGSCAVDGVAAIKCFVEQRPNLVLLDVDMPRLRGLERLAVRGELSPETRGSMVSGRAEEHEARRALALGAFDFIAKPFDIARLSEVDQVAAS